MKAVEMKTVEGNRKQAVPAFQPGDTIRLEINILAMKKGFFKMSASASVDGVMAVEGELSAMVMEAPEPA